MASGTFGFDIAIQDMKIKMLGKLQYGLSFKFQCFFVLCFNFQISMPFLVFLLIVVDAWWTSYGKIEPHLQNLVI